MHLPPQVIQRQHRDLRRSLRGLQREGFRKVHVLSGVDEVARAEIAHERRYNDLRHLTGPFDVIGDIHGCRAELESLLVELGYGIARDEAGGRSTPHTPRAGPPCSSATWSTADRTPRACCAW